LEFLGGPILVIPSLYIYLRYIAKVSSRWYLDIAAPALPWGLAITRIGCFLNGCCWGATCTDPHDPAHERSAIPWAVHFPYGSPAMGQQYQFGQLTLPKELIWIRPGGDSEPLPRECIDSLLKDGGKQGRELHERLDAAQQKLEAAKNQPETERRIL